MATKINFQRLREGLNFEHVLETYGIEASMKGEQAIALCPFHEDKKTKSFSANTERNIFQCFSCKTKGNILEFCIRMEGFNPDDKKAFRAGAIKVQARFGGEHTTMSTGMCASLKPRDTSSNKTTSTEVVSSDSSPEADVQRVVNAPLDFELKSIDAQHLYLSQRGLTPETIAHFGLGVCSRGLMKGRAVIPLHDVHGQLIGYAGRRINDESVDDEQPKYLLPGKREVNGVLHEFWKSEFVFNGHRMGHEPHDYLIIVEGFFQAMRLHQCGYPNVVALMGASLSEKQAILIDRYTKNEGRIYLFPDGDEAGDRLAHDAVARLAKNHWVRWIRLPGGGDVDSISEENLCSLMKQVGL